MNDRYLLGTDINGKINSKPKIRHSDLRRPCQKGKSIAQLFKENQCCHPFPNDEKQRLMMEHRNVCVFKAMNTMLRAFYPNIDNEQ